MPIGCASYWEALHERLDVLVQHRVQGDFARPGLELQGGRQLAEDDEVGRLQVVAVFGELLDRIAPIEQDAFVAVDVSDGAAAVRRVHEGGVVGHQAEVVWPGLDLPEVHGPDGPVLNRQLVLLPGPVVDDGQRVALEVQWLESEV
jgi:hypothetical protein